MEVKNPLFKEDFGLPPNTDSTNITSVIQENVQVKDETIASK
jgi:hypothetical protein